MPWESELCSLCISLGPCTRGTRPGALCPRQAGCYSCPCPTVLLTCRHRLKGKSIENLKMMTAVVDTDGCRGCWYEASRPPGPLSQLFLDGSHRPQGPSSAPAFLPRLKSDGEILLLPHAPPGSSALLVHAWVLILLEPLSEPFLLTPHRPVNPSEYVSCVQ